MSRHNVNTYFQIIRLYKYTVSWQKIPVFDLADIAYNYVANRDLFNLTSPYNGELVFTLYPTLQASKLSFFRVIIEGCYNYDYYNWNKNG